MPIAGLGLHVILAIVCAVHAVRTRQNTYWLFVLFAFPLLGSVVYALAVFLPYARLRRRATKAVSTVIKTIDSTRQVREARLAFDETPTAQNQMRLASALLDIGDAGAAAEQFEACLKGPFAQDPEVRFGAAKAYTECQAYGPALRLLQSLSRERPDVRPEAVALLTARSLAGVGQADEARQTFETAVARFGTFEAMAEYAIWACAMGDRATIERLCPPLDKIRGRWGAMTRELNEPVIRRLDAARKLAESSR